LKEDTTNRILIIHPEGGTLSNPSLKSIIDLLLKSGFKVDLRCPQSTRSPDSYLNVGFLAYGALIRKAKTILIERLSLYIGASILVFLEKLFLYGRYDLIIGVDRQGLVEASILARLLGVKHVYISFEIMFEEETSRRYKSLERKTTKNVSMWIVQDYVREEELQKENSMDISKSFLLPVSSTGAGKFSPARLRDELGIPNEKKVAILIGSLCEWTMADEIIKSTESWPDEWVLVIHERHGNALEFMDGLRGRINMGELLGLKVFVSTKLNVAVDDLGYILNGIDAGFALYKPTYSSKYTGKNLQYIGEASGKISTYLRYGIPIITNEIGLYSTHVRESKIGEIVESSSHIFESLIKLSDNDEFSKNAITFFSSHLDFVNYEEFLLSRIKQVMTS
jgi:hypothetical protein